MLKLSTALPAVTMLLSAGAAAAQMPQPHTMAVDLPDGSVAHVAYFGEVAPQVTVAMIPPPDYGDRDFYECYDSYGYFGHYSPCFRHRPGHGTRRAVAGPPANAVVLQSLPPQFVVPNDAAPGSRYHYTLISTAPDGRVCTQQTRWQSRGRHKEPLITRTDVGEGCASLAGPPRP
jgi:hypothetical protein